MQRNISFWESLCSPTVDMGSSLGRAQTFHQKLEAPSEPDALAPVAVSYTGNTSYGFKLYHPSLISFPVRVASVSEMPLLVLWTPLCGPTSPGSDEPLEQDLDADENGRVWF